MKLKIWGTACPSLLCCACLVFPPAWAAEESVSARRIEEIIVTAEKRESTVSDTSISITAFGQEQIEEFGIQGADELVNFIPSTTRDAYDIRIRGVGRNFRALGGDPGVATYYNGVYSEDFGIAASENGLYDVERVEVLRGPQGTLYGRNSIGGALNYISNMPSYEFEAELRAMFGNLDTQEYYGVISGPIIPDKLAYRLVGLRRDRDGSQKGLAGSEDINSIGDQNFSIALNWRIADNWEANIRWNDRKSDRIIGSGSLVSEGTGSTRGVRSTDVYANGYVLDPAGSVMVPDPMNPGSMLAARHVIPGVDVASRTNANGIYFGPTRTPDDYGHFFDPDTKDLKGWRATNDNNDEKFDHNAVQGDLTWDINDTTSLKYIGGWMQFDYTFDIDSDTAAGTLSNYRSLVLESVETYSHELQLLWQLGDALQLTSGAYYFNSDRLQNFSFNDVLNQGRYTNPANYGFYDAFVVGPHTRLGDGPVGGIVTGRWEGDPDGAAYEYANTVETDAYAFYTQGTYTFNEQWALTLGIRWAEDKKKAFENRTGYFELSPVLFTGPSPDCSPLFALPAGSVACTSVGVTPLALANIYMGNASYDYFGADPNSPIVSTCPGGMADETCQTPLRLMGIPYSFADALEGKDKWNKVTWRANLDWTPNDDTLMYASVTTGYRAGGFALGIGDSRETTSEGTRVPRTYDKEDVIAYELGYKGTLFDGRMQLNGSWYYYDYDNYQDRVEEFNSGSQSSSDVATNVDKAKNMGIELELTWLATDNWTIGGNYSWADTEYRSDFFVLEDDNPDLPLFAFTGTAAEFDEIFVRNLKGNNLKRIPEHKATLWSYYDFVFSPGTLSLGGTFSYTGSFWDSGITRSLDKVPERYRLDLSATWRDNRDRFIVRAFVDNVTDEGRSRGFDTLTVSSNYNLTADYLYPRFYGVDMTVRFTNF